MDTERFESLFAEHYGPVVAYARRRGASWDQAHDVAAEVFAVAWRRRDHVPLEAAQPWLLGVARKVQANQWRSRRRWLGLTARIARAAPEPALLPDPVAAADPALADALASLDEADREVLRLVAWDELAHDEIGELLGLSASGVASRLSRARERLRRALDAHPGRGATEIERGVGGT